jgi:hypothetical protein
LFVISRWVNQLFISSTLFHYTQDIFAAQGPNATWDYVGKISPAIPTLCAVKDHVEATINPYFRYKKHTTPDAEKDIAGLAEHFTVFRQHVKRPRQQDVTIQDYARKGSVKTTYTKYLEIFHKKRTLVTRSTEDRWQDESDMQVDSEAEDSLDEHHAAIMSEIEVLEDQLESV